jgi:predicted RNA-binding protein with RPS1 domain
MSDSDSTTSGSSLPSSDDEAAAPAPASKKRAKAVASEAGSKKRVKKVAAAAAAEASDSDSDGDADADDSADEDGGKAGNKTYNLGEVVVGESYRGQLVKLTPRGVFVRLKGVRPDGFCHISMLSDKYVTDVENDRWVHLSGAGGSGSKPKLGQWVRARVIDVHMKKKQITLSLQSDKMRAQEIAAVTRHNRGLMPKGTKNGGAWGAGRAEGGGEGTGGVGGEGGGVVKPGAEGLEGKEEPGKKRSAAKQAKRNERRLAKKGIIVSLTGGDAAVAGKSEGAAGGHVKF